MMNQAKWYSMNTQSEARGGGGVSSSGNSHIMIDWPANRRRKKDSRELRNYSEEEKEGWFDSLISSSSLLVYELFAGHEYFVNNSII